MLKTKKRAVLGFMPRTAFWYWILGQISRCRDVFCSPVALEASSSSRAFREAFCANVNGVREGREKWLDTLEIFWNAWKVQIRNATLLRRHEQLQYHRSADCQHRPPNQRTQFVFYLWNASIFRLRYSALKTPTPYFVYSVAPKHGHKPEATTHTTLHKNQRQASRRRIRSQEYLPRNGKHNRTNHRRT